MRPAEPIRGSRGAGRLLAALLSAMLLVGCSGLRSLETSLRDPIAPQALTLEDGSRARYYELNDARDRDTLVFFMPSFGCPSLKYYLRHYFAGLDPRIGVVARQKRDVEDGDLGLSCSTEFDRSNTLDVWLADQQAFIRAYLRERARPARVALWGASEGGVLALSLVRRIPEASHVVIVGAGALPQREELRLLAEKGVFPKDMVEDGLSRVAAAPDTVEERFLGSPHRYWSSKLDTDPRAWLASVRSRWLIGFGERDESVPLESGQELRRVLSESGKDVSLIVYPGAGHTLGETNRVDFMRKASEWLLR